jgi:SAM-dependent methyltransferase
MKLSPTEAATLVGKSSKDPELVALYMREPYLVAYAQHTDMRVERDGTDAIGGLWDEYGDLSLVFLIEQGLRPHSRLIDFGCGMGRLARKVVPYLNPREYYGYDISPKALDYARELSQREGWAARLPTFALPYSPLVSCDFIWAFSVMIHLPPEEVRAVFRLIRTTMHKGSRFLFSYVPSPVHVRTDLKQFKHPYEFYEECATENGLSLTRVESWAGRQKIALASRSEVHP